MHGSKIVTKMHQVKTGAVTVKYAYQNIAIYITIVHEYFTGNFAFLCEASIRSYIKNQEAVLSIQNTPHPGL